MRPAALVANPHVDAKVREVDGEALHIDVCAYSPVRGFARVRLSRGETPAFAAAMRFLAAPAGSDPASLGLSPVELVSLWQAGLVAAPQECADVFVMPDTAAFADDAYRRNGFALLPACVRPPVVAALVRYYRMLVADGALRRGDRQADRYWIHNDPVGRVVQHALRDTVERIVGSPVKASYTYASLYCGGTTLPIHTDRPQCRYSLSLLIDHRPLPADGLSPWPLQIFPEPDAPPVEFHQPIGGGLLFRGHEIPHARPALPAAEDCWVMLLHYVDADFAGSLD